MKFFGKAWGTIFSVGIFLFLVAIGGITIFLFTDQNQTFTSNKAVQETEISQDNQCPSLGKEEKVVRGSSLAGILEHGQTIEVLLGYYDCYPIEREDIVLYDYRGNDNPIIKIVKGVTGDKLHLQKEGSGWHVLINDRIVENSKGEPYLLDLRRYKLLSAYEKDYGGVLPENTYLILGNISTGSVDSTRFGLIGKKDILGKVILIKN